MSQRNRVKKNIIVRSSAKSANSRRKSFPPASPLLGSSPPISTIALSTIKDLIELKKDHDDIAVMKKPDGENMFAKKNVVSHINVKNICRESNEKSPGRAMAAQALLEMMRYQRGTHMSKYHI